MNLAILLFIYYSLMCTPFSEARGGRGRSGGGISGNWRRGKTSGSSFNGRNKAEQFIKPHRQFNNKVNSHSYYLQNQAYMQQSELFYLNIVPRDAIYYPHSTPFSFNWGNFTIKNYKNTTKYTRLNDSVQSHRLDREKRKNSFICMSTVINEAVAANISKHAKKLVCFPASLDLPKSCVMRTFIQTDPSDPARAIEVVRPLCSTAREKQVEPVVGDIVNTNDDVSNETSVMKS